MLRLFHYLIFGHCHKWKIIKEGWVDSPSNGAKWIRFTLQCEHCGDIKYKDPNPWQR